MVPPPHEHRFTFSQLSVGLQILLIVILVGSCSGGSNNAVINDSGAGSDVGSDVSMLSEDVQRLEREVRRLRAEIRRNPR